MNTRIITTALAASILAIPAIADAPGYFKVPGTETTMKVYGQVELRNSYGLDGFNDLGELAGNEVGAFGGYDASVLQKGQFKTSYRGRIGVTTTTPSAFGDVNVKVEMQANSKAADTEPGFTLRHAYGEIGGFLLGQTDSLFGFGHYEPNSLWGLYSDENGPWEKTRQVRYTFAPAPGMNLAFSIESKTANNDDIGGTKEPVAVGAFNYSADWGGVAATVGYQKVRSHEVTTLPYVKTTDSANGTSWALSGCWNITPKDVLTAMIVNAGGTWGSGYYDGFMESPVDGDVVFYKTTTMNIAYGHTWSDTFSSNVGIGQVTWKKDEDADRPYNDHKATLTEFFVNSYWQATPTVKFGAEYQYAQTKFSGVDGFYDKNDNAKGKNKGSEIRILAMFKFF